MEKEMNSRPMLLEWFRGDRLPGTLPDAVIVAGGTRLLAEFLSLTTADRDGGELSIAVPNTRFPVAHELPEWKALPYSHIDLRLVTNGRGGAGRFLSEAGSLGWRSLVLHTRARLHSNIYTFIGAQGGGACLIGSHNLTRGGAQTNEEAGVLFRADRDPDIRRIIHSCNDQITQLIRDSDIYTDTMHWPSGRGTV
jgi:hypothetical protein